MPDIWPENYKSWEVFSIASSQMLVVGMGTPLGLQFQAIDRALTHAGVHDLDRAWMWDHVRQVGEAYAKHLRERQEADNPNQKSGVMQPPPMFGKNRLAAMATLEKLEQQPGSAIDV